MLSLKQEIDQHFAMSTAMRAAASGIAAIADALFGAVSNGGTIYLFGNGGSAAEAMHFSGELIGRFQSNRRPLAAHCLCADPAALTCIGNDFSFSQIYARQVQALAGPGDIVVGFTTSGASENVIAGLEAARSAGAETVIFTGESGRAAAVEADYAFVSPSARTARVQEMHQLAMHLICARLETLVAEDDDD